MVDLISIYVCETGNHAARRHDERHLTQASSIEA